LKRTAFELKREIKIKAAILEKLNCPLVIRELELTELKIGQVLVKVIVSGICGSQLHEINGNKGNGKFLPHLMGHEGCGLVEEVGPGVTKVKPGDKVVMHWRPGYGIESDFPKYKFNGKDFLSGKVNTLTEVAIVSENRLTVVPPGTNAEFAALLGCSLTTALGVIDNESNLKFGERVAVVGCGGVGLNVLTAARLRGAGEIYAVDTVTAKNKLCLDHGATYFHTSVAELPTAIDLVIDTTGVPEVISELFLKLSNKGRILLLGQPIPGQSLVFPDALKLFNGAGLSIRASQGGSTVPQDDIPRYIELLKLGLLSIDKLVTHRFNLAEINLAFETLKSGTAGRIMINTMKAEK
jgi:S-(hydroxymethyl)glutathione dehydrogenase / alcohol dehydrogenase